MPSKFIINSTVEGVLADLEIQRKEIVSNKLKGWIAIALGLILLFVILSLGALVIGAIVGGIAIIYGAVILYRITETVTSYKNRFKHEVIGTVLSTTNSSLTISPNQGISESEFRSSQLFTTEPDRYYTEDLISGQVDKTRFYFAEVHAEYKTETQTKNGRQVHWHNILKGIMFSADFNKHFNGITLVRPKDLSSSISAWFSKNVFSIGQKDVVQLENDAFNQNFITYSTDQVEARYILTPAMMERISTLNERCAYTISLSFINSTVYIAFPLDKNYFEAPIFKTLLSPDLLEDDISVLRFMYDISLELDLNTRIWTKQ